MLVVSYQILILFEVYCFSWPTKNTQRNIKNCPQRKDLCFHYGSDFSFIHQNNLLFCKTLEVSATQCNEKSSFAKECM